MARVAAVWVMVVANVCCRVSSSAGVEGLDSTPTGPNAVHMTSNQVVYAASRPARTAVEVVAPAPPEVDGAGTEDETDADADGGTDEVLLDDPLPELHAASRTTAAANPAVTDVRFIADSLPHRGPAERSRARSAAGSLRPRSGLMPLRPAEPTG